MLCQYPQLYLSPSSRSIRPLQCHSFATQAVRQGVGIPVVSKLLGHRKIEMTMRYTHASNTDAEAAAERIGKQIEALSEGRAVASEATQTKERDKIHRT